MGHNTITRPIAGARYVLGLVEQQRPLMVYRGQVHLPDADLPLEVRLELRTDARSGIAASAVIVGGGRDVAELERHAIALVKAAVRSAARQGRPEPRKIARWRG